MAKKLDFSIVLPTYSGEETIQHTLNSLMKQTSRVVYELVIIIDGPNDNLREIVDGATKKFGLKKVQVKTKQFKKNQGRFVARVEGAMLASCDQLLFIDDRIELDDEYFKKLRAINHNLIMPNVIEVEDKVTLISLTLRLVRKKLYGNKWGEEFEDYEIDNSNFEFAPKGAAALWVKKDVFLKACQEVTDQQGGTMGRFTNEDTRVLKAIVNKNNKILRTSKLKIFYRPRIELKQEIKHLYARGPRFIDYYLRPGTRFFVPIILFYFILLLGLTLLIFYPLTALFSLTSALLILILFSIYLAGISVNIWRTFAGLILIIGSFGAGIIKGTCLKIISSL